MQVGIARKPRYPVGFYLGLRCVDGYEEADGRRTFTFTCNQDGFWQPQLPTCSAKGNCPRLLALWKSLYLRTNSGCVIRKFPSSTMKGDVELKDGEAFTLGCFRWFVSPRGQGSTTHSCIAGQLKPPVTSQLCSCVHRRYIYGPFYDMCPFGPRPFLQGPTVSEIQKSTATDQIIYSKIRILAFVLAFSTHEYDAIVVSWQHDKMSVHISAHPCDHKPFHPQQLQQPINTWNRSTRVLITQYSVCTSMAYI